jgi:hypothetical protein
LTYFNPLVVVVEGAWRLSPAAEQYAERASAARRARWAESHPRVTASVTTPDDCPQTRTR